MLMGHKGLPGNKNPAYKGPYCDRFCRCGCGGLLKNKTSQERRAIFLPNHFKKSREEMLAMAKNAIKKTQETLFKRYGTTNPAQVVGAMDKRRKTWKKRYGVTNVGLLCSSPTSIEVKIWNYLSSLNVIFFRNYNVGRYFIDAAIPEGKIAVEADGDYWHRNRKELDTNKDKYLLKKGWTVIRLSESLIKKDFPACEQILSQAIFIGGDVANE